MSPILSSSERADVVVAGGGAIGLAVAWRCAGRGLSVVVVDSADRTGAWHTAAGMLAPAGELHTTERSLLRLNLDSAARWPAFAAELSAESGLELGYRRCGTVVAAWDGADLAALRMLHALAGELGVPTELLTGGALRELEPALAAGLPGGLLAPGDHQVDPRRLHEALTIACTRRGVRVVISEAALLLDRDQVRGVRVAGGRVLSTRRVVVAAGAWSGRIDGLPDGFRVPVRPVKGQTLRLRSRARISRVVRGSVAGSAVYVVPRTDGTVVVGASSEEAGFDLAPRAGAVYELLRDAQALIPELSESTLDEVCTGLRPGSPDNAPVIGPAGLDGLWWATGHHRNGILLAPATADAVAASLAGEPDEVLETFSPRRFTAATA